MACYPNGTAQQRAHQPGCHILPISTKGSIPLSRPDTPKLISMSSTDSTARLASHHEWALHESPQQQQLQQQQPGIAQDPFGDYQPLMEPLLPVDSSPAQQQHSSPWKDRTRTHATPAETHESSHESSRGGRMTDVQQPETPERHSRSMKSPGNLGSSLYRHDSAASCAAEDDPGGPPLNGRWPAPPAPRRGTLDQTSPSNLSCSFCRGCGRGGSPRHSGRAWGSPLEISTSRQQRSGEQTDDPHEQSCQNERRSWHDNRSGNHGHSVQGSSLRDAVQILDKHGACHGDCSRRSSATEFPFDDLVRTSFACNAGKLSNAPTGAP